MENCSPRNTESGNVEIPTLESLVASNAENISVLSIANQKFEELCLTLESEQARLFDLEERRKQLHEEMKSLRDEIEREKDIYRNAIDDTIASGIAEDESINSAKTDQMLIESAMNQNANIHEWGIDTESIKSFIERERNELDGAVRENFQLHQLQVCPEMEEKEEDEELFLQAAADFEHANQDVLKFTSKIPKKLIKVDERCKLEEVKSSATLDQTEEAFFSDNE